jgi:hypothetical protein
MKSLEEQKRNARAAFEEQYPDKPEQSWVFFWQGWIEQSYQNEWENQNLFHNQLQQNGK